MTNLRHPDKTRRKVVLEHLADHPESTMAELVKVIYLDLRKCKNNAYSLLQNMVMNGELSSKKELSMSEPHIKRRILYSLRSSETPHSKFESKIYESLLRTFEADQYFYVQEETRVDYQTWAKKQIRKKILSELLDETQEI